MLILRRRKTKSYALQDLSAGLPNYNPAAMALFALNTNYTGAGYDPHYITVEEAANMTPELVFRVLDLVDTSLSSDTTVTAFNEYRYFLKCKYVGDGYTYGGVYYPQFFKLRALREVTMPPTIRSVAMSQLPIFRRVGYSAAMQTVRLTSDVNLDLSFPLHTKFSGAVDCDVVFAGDNPLLNYRTDGVIESATALKYVPRSYQGELILSESLTSMDCQVLRNCPHVTRITNLKPWPENNSDARIIGWAEFENCSSLTEIDIPDGIRHIGANMFSGCTSLARCGIPSSVMYIGGGGDYQGSAFRNCTSLSSLVLPDSIVSMVGIYNLSGCTSLSSLVLPAGLSAIPSYTCYGDSSLTTITLHAPAPPTLVGTRVFADAPLTAIYVPSGSVSDYQTASGWSDYASIIQSI